MEWWAAGTAKTPSRDVTPDDYPFSPHAERPSDGGPLIEIGFVLESRLDPVDRVGVRAAIADLGERLAQWLPGFEWRLPIVERELDSHAAGQTALLLEFGALDLALYHWDYAIVVTAAELQAVRRPNLLAAPSRVLGVGVLSTLRLDPLARRESVTDAERQAVLRSRVRALVQLLLGHLGGLSERVGTAMAVPTRESDLDDPKDFDARQLGQLSAEWARVADSRLEEESRPGGALTFYLRACWRNRRELWSTFWRSRPWELPFRLGRLTTAAISALAVALLTAESWDVGVRLTAGTEIVLALIGIVATAFYVLRRQRLLSAISKVDRTEQAAVARVSVVGFALVGMAVTYATLVGIALALGHALFDAELVARWTGSQPAAITGAAYARQALFVATLSAVVGALGVSFEGQAYVKHVAYVDDEF